MKEISTQPWMHNYTPPHNRFSSKTPSRSLNILKISTKPWMLIAQLQMVIHRFHLMSVQMVSSLFKILLLIRMILHIHHCLRGNLLLLLLLIYIFQPTVQSSMMAKFIYIIQKIGRQLHQPIMIQREIQDSLCYWFTFLIATYSNIQIYNNASIYHHEKKSIHLALSKIQKQNKHHVSTTWRLAGKRSFKREYENI